MSVSDLQGALGLQLWPLFGDPGCGLPFFEPHVGQLPRSRDDVRCRGEELPLPCRAFHHWPGSWTSVIPLLLNAWDIFIGVPMRQDRGYGASFRTIEKYPESLQSFRYHQD